MTRAGLASAGNVVPLQGAVILELDPEERTALELTLTHLRPLLAGDNVTEICINEPGRVFIEDHKGWHVEQCPFVSLAWCEALSRLVGNATKQRVNAQEPLLSGELPTGERFQIVLPPATTKETVSVTLRVPSRQVWTLDEIAERGMLAECRWSHDHSYDDPSHPQYRELQTDEQEMIALLQESRFVDFLRLAVQAERNIVLSGETGSGKTTVGKALMLEIPSYERLVTIEDARELVVVNQPNHVRLYFSKGGQGQASVTPEQLLEAALRMRPDRLVVSEIRGEEGFAFMNMLLSGHNGALTSVHAVTPRAAFKRLAKCVMKSAQAGGMSQTMIEDELFTLIDVVCQFDKKKYEDGRAARLITEIWYDPIRKRGRTA